MKFANFNFKFNNGHFFSKVCYKAKEDNNTWSGVLAKSSNVSWLLDDEILYQYYYEPTDVIIQCTCAENQTIPVFDKIPIGSVIMILIIDITFCYIT